MLSAQTAVPSVARNLIEVSIRQNSRIAGFRKIESVGVTISIESLPQEFWLIEFSLDLQAESDFQMNGQRHHPLNDL